MPWKVGISATEQPGCAPLQALVCGPRVGKQARVGGRVTKFLQDDKPLWKAAKANCQAPDHLIPGHIIHIYLVQRVAHFLAPVTANGNQ